MRFRVYYGDGSTYEGTGDAGAFAAPQLDVQVIAYEDASERGFSLLYGKQLRVFYVWRNRHWFLTDEAGFWDYILNHQGAKQILHGRTMLHVKDFDAIKDRARVEGLGP